MSIEKADSAQDWGGRFEDAWKRQILAGLSVSPAERLRWLEEAIRFADKAGALARVRPSGP